MSWSAVVREVSPALAECELTHLAREPINLERAMEQHRAYRDVLRAMGAEVQVLPALEAFPDSVFVEDVAVVVDEAAVLTRPGAASRRGEVALMEPVLARVRPVHRLEGDATLDGGDVLVMGKTVWVGTGGRTNTLGVEQLRRILKPRGYRVQEVRVSGCLHLKSAVTGVNRETVLLNPAYVDPAVFQAYRQVEVDSTEPAAANILHMGEELLFSEQYPRTRERLVAAGFQPRLVDSRELAKAEGALTCCSLIFRKAP